MSGGILKIDIFSYLKGDGFKKADSSIDKTESKASKLTGAFKNSFGGMVAGALTVVGAIQQINKSMDLAAEKNAQITKLTATMRGMGISDDRTKSVIDYAQAMADVGTVGRAVTLAATQQMATYNLTDESLKKLIPSMQDIIVQSKGLNASTGDGVNVANMFGKAILGQAGELQQAGVSLTKHQEQLIRTGTQEEKVAALIDAVRMNVGEQNKEFAQTPEGKIRMTQNRIMSLYEDVGNKFIQSKSDYYSFLNDNFDTIKKYVTGAVDFLMDLGDIAKSVAGTIGDVWSGLGQDVKVVLIGIGVAIAATFAPITTAIIGTALVVQDLWVAFKGGDSAIGRAFDAMSEFLDLGVNFSEFRQGIIDIWASLKDSGVGEFLVQSLVFPIKYAINLLKIFIQAINFSVKTTSALLDLAGSLLTGKVFDFDWSKFSKPAGDLADTFNKNFDFTKAFKEGYQTPGKSEKIDTITKNTNNVSNINKNDTKNFNKSIMNKSDVKNMTTKKEQKINIKMGDIKINATGVNAKEVADIIDKKQKESNKKIINELKSLGGD